VFQDTEAYATAEWSLAESHSSRNRNSVGYSPGTQETDNTLADD